ncbi:MAG: hypothetical protein ABUT20_26350 [Bacteroidota bacterium]
MAITANCSSFLFFSKLHGASFEKTLTLGRLNLYASKENILADIRKFKNEVVDVEKFKFPAEYSEPIFQILGASEIDSMDYSDYENATIIHDLNSPIPENLKNKFTAVVDGGTIEHIFNFPMAIRNCMEMLKTGGSYIGITPANNIMGHGFYQFSPELYFNIFSEANGFKVVKMLIVTQHVDGTYSSWYEVANPRQLKSRITLTNSKPTFLMVFAQKIEEKLLFEKTPQQSDYEMVWDIKESMKGNKAQEQSGWLKHMYRKFTPRPLKVLAHNVYNLFTKQEIIDEDLGQINERHFKKIEI